MIAQLLELDCIPVGMEQFSASPMTQSEYIEKMLETTDFMVLIISGRYGSINKETGFSYTEDEYNLAKEKNIPILIFINNDIGSLPSSKVESKEELRVRLEKFRNKCSENRLVNFYTNKDNLIRKIASSIHNLINETEMQGWIREEEIIETLNQKDEEIRKLNLKFSELESKNQENPELASTAEVLNAWRRGQLQAERSDLSVEAEVLAKEAALSKTGEIIYLHFIGGRSLGVNGKEMLTDQDPRIIAYWENGLEELEREGYIKSNPDKTIYQLTANGYKYVDFINNL